MNKEKIVYSIDIGTRTVVGVLSQNTENGLKILDYEIEAHDDRSMYDGQVHNIAAVSRVIRRVTDKLRDRNDVEIVDVSIAAAGRSLKTEKVTIEKKLDSSRDITKDVIDAVEIEAIELAQENIREKIGDSEIEYYCVGNSVISMILDEINLDNPIGHRGRNLKVDLVATFLPRSVSDTLYKVVTDAGLQILGLTLEPIAAVEIAVPKKLRLLNLAIVDVGAGTSDIALTKNGGIYSYAMVDLAGDEITEAIAKTYLLGFDEAEALKTELASEENHRVTNVVGVMQNVTTEEVIDKIDSTIDEICRKIAEEILNINKEAPDALFIIGGGGKLPTFRERVAKFLELDLERVAMKSVEDVKNIEFETEVGLAGPEFVTPIGIGLIGHRHNKRDFISINLNGNALRLFNSKKLTISDALVLTGYNPRNLIANRGDSVKFRLNNKTMIKHGKAGTVPMILLNGAVASIHDDIKHYDNIEITDAKRGEDAKVYLHEVVDFNSYVLVSGERHPRLVSCEVNGKTKESNYLIKNGDEIKAVYFGNEPALNNVTSKIQKAVRPKESVGVDNMEVAERDDLNQQPEVEKKVEDHIETKETDNITSFAEDKLLAEERAPKLRRNLGNKPTSQLEIDDVDIDVENEEGLISFSEIKAQHNVDDIDTESSDDKLISVQLNGSSINVSTDTGKTTIKEVFNTINYRVDNAMDNMSILLNGKQTTLQQEIQDGDSIRIRWV